MGSRCLTVLAAFAATMLLAGCADLITPVEHSTAVVPTFVRITISTERVHGPVYLQGVIRFIRIAGSGADIEKELETDGETRVRLPGGGNYRMASWVRPCGRTCSTLKEPVGRCSTLFTAAAGQTTAIEIRAPMRRDCTITVGG
jgi:hypothetical protein